MRLPFLRAGLVLACCLLAPGPALAGDPPPTSEILQRLQKAADAFHRDRDPALAAKLYSEIVDAHPEDPSARMGRALFFEQFSGMVKEEARAKYVGYALQDLSWVAEKDPDGFWGGSARDGIRRLRGEALFPTARVSCPPEATEAYDRAEREYGGGRYRESLPHYAVATERCPAGANYWLSYADAHAMLGDDAQAKLLFEKAIAADPWNGVARRMLSRVEMRLGDAEAAFRQSAMAVIADPESEASWSALRTVAEQTGRAWHRVYAQKPEVGAGAKPGDTHITLPIFGNDAAAEDDGTDTKGLSREERKRRKQAKKAEEAAESAALVPWMTYAMHKALEVSKTQKAPLEVERESIGVALTSSKEAGSAGAPFWAMLHRAKDAGFLDEAIYFHLMDAQLAPGYRAHREAHPDRLLDYLRNVLAPRMEPPQQRERTEAKS
jgi:tetratricopeptide (TPR) repeat protein